MVDCIFNSYYWQNGSRVNVTMAGEEREEIFAIGEDVPEEIANPRWLENEKETQVKAIREAKDHAGKKAKNLYVDTYLANERGFDSYVKFDEERDTLGRAIENADAEEAILNARTLLHCDDNHVAVIKGWHALARRARMG